MAVSNATSLDTSSMNSEREATIVRFSVAGGVDIESSWHENKELSVPVGGSLDDVAQVLCTLHNHHDTR
jgi:hypothetical protein